MRIEYDESSDTLRIELSTEPVVRDVSRNWHINLGYSADDALAEITILEARSHGAWPIEIVTTSSAPPHTSYSSD